MRKEGSITSSDGHCGHGNCEDPPVGLDALGCIKPKSKIFYNLTKFGQVTRYQFDHFNQFRIGPPVVIFGKKIALLGRFDY